MVQIYLTSINFIEGRGERETPPPFFRQLKLLPDANENRVLRGGGAGLPSARSRGQGRYLPTRPFSEEHWTSWLSVRYQARPDFFPPRLGLTPGLAVGYVGSSLPHLSSKAQTHF